MHVESGPLGRLELRHTYGGQWLARYAREYLRLDATIDADWIFTFSLLILPRLGGLRRVQSITLEGLNRNVQPLASTRPTAAAFALRWAAPL